MSTRLIICALSYQPTHCPPRARIVVLVKIESDDIDGLKLHSTYAKVERTS